MGLLLHLAGKAIGLSLRFALLVAGLFAAHLVIKQVIPPLRETASLVEQVPLIEQELAGAEAALSNDEQRLRLLDLELESRSEAAVARLKLEAATQQKLLETLGQQRQQAILQLTEGRAQVDAYCDSYNPFKRWFCSDMRRRHELLEAQLSDAIARLSGQWDAAQQHAASLDTRLAQLAYDRAAAVQVLRQQAPEATEQLLQQIAAIRQQSARTLALLGHARERQRRALAAQNSALGWLLREWSHTWPKLAALAALVMVVPFAQRTLGYFAFMPLVDRARPLRLSRPDGRATLRTSPACRTLHVELEPGQTLYVRPTYARPIEGRARSRLLYRYSAPFISYAAGLFLLTELVAKHSTICKQQGAVTATLAAPDDPDMYLMRIDLEQHPGLVIHPRHLVGVIGNLELRTRWKPWSLHAWSTWQLRYILLAGTGSAIIEGRGDIVAGRLSASRVKIEQDLVVGFDSQLGYRTGRTETFLPYLFGKTPLVDDVFEHTGSYFWQKSRQRQRRGVLERSMDAFWSALGRLLGF